MLGADQATSHYLKQWWLVYWCIYVSLCLNEIIKDLTALWIQLEGWPRAIRHHKLGAFNTWWNSHMARAKIWNPTSNICHKVVTWFCCVLFVVHILSTCSGFMRHFHSYVFRSLYWHWGNHMIAPVPVKWSWKITCDFSQYQMTTNHKI